MNCKPVFLFLLFLVITFSLLYPQIELFDNSKTKEWDKCMNAAERLCKQNDCLGVNKGDKWRKGEHDNDAALPTGCFVHTNILTKPPKEKVTYYLGFNDNQTWGAKDKGKNYLTVDMKTASDKATEEKIYQKYKIKRLVPKYLQDRDKSINTYLKPILNNPNLEKYNIYQKPTSYSNKQCDENQNKNCLKTFDQNNSVFVDNNFSIWKPNLSKDNFQYVGEWKDMDVLKDEYFGIVSD